MRKAYPASQLHRRVLRSPPKAAHCLPPGDGQALRSLSGNIVFLWLKNGSGFWYQLRRAENGRLLGYALSGGWWRLQPVSLRRVYRYF
jgi:hypothetical protein